MIMNNRKLLSFIFVSTALTSFHVHAVNYVMPPNTLPTPLTLNTVSADTLTGNAGGLLQYNVAGGVAVTMNAGTSITLNGGTGATLGGSILGSGNPGTIAVRILGGNTTINVNGSADAANPDYGSISSTRGTAIDTVGFVGDGNPISLNFNAGTGAGTAGGGVKGGVGQYAINFSNLTTSVPTINLNTGATATTSAGTAFASINLPSVANSFVSILGAGVTLGGLTKVAGGGGTASVAIQGNLTGGNFNNVDNISVQNNSTFTASTGAINGFTIFSVDVGSTAKLQTSVTGAPGAGITNNGTLEVATGGSTTATITTNSGLLTLSGGTTGNLAGTGTNVLTITGNYTTGGTIGGYQTINVNGGTFVINQAITGSTSFANNSIVTINNGGNYAGAMTGGASSTLNIDVTAGNTFTTPGALTGVKLLNVVSGGLTVNQAVTGFTNFTIGGDGATLSPGGSFSGSTIAVNSPLTVAAGVTGGIAAPILGNSTASSQLALNENFSTSNTISNLTTLTLALGKTLTVANTISGLSIFNNSGTTVVNSGGGLSATTINGGALTLNSGGTLSGTLASPTNLTITGGTANTTVNNATTVAISGGTLTGPINNPTNFTLSGGAVNGNVASTGAIGLSGGSITGNITGTSNITITGPFTTGGTIAANALAVNAPGVFTINRAVTSSTFTNTGLVIASSGGSVSSTIDSTGGGNITVNGGTLNGSVNNTNTLTLQSGAINNAITNTNTLIMSGGTVTGAINNPTTLTMSAGTVTGAINNPTTFNLSGGTVNGSVANATTINLSGGGISGNITGAPTINITGTYATNGTIAANIVNVSSTGILTLNNALTASIFNLNGGSVTGNLGNIGTINIASGSITGNMTTTTTNINITGPFTTGGNILGNIAVSNASTFTIINALTPASFSNLGSTIINNGGSVSSAITGAGNITVNNGTLSGPISNTNVLTFNEGAINNTITDANTINMTGGILTGNITTANPLSPATTLNLSGGAINGNVLAQTINVSGGSITGAITGSPNVNINDDYTTGGTISANQINVNNFSVFTVNNTITPNVLTIAEEATTILNQSSSGTISNNGTLLLNSDMTGSILNNTGTITNIPTTRNIGGSFTQNPGGTLAVVIQDKSVGDYGRLLVAGPATFNGALEVNLANNGVTIANDDRFDIVTANGGLNPSNPTIQFPQSLVLSFARDTSPSVPVGVYRLKAVRQNFTSIVSSSVVNGVTGALDTLRTSNPNSFMLGVLETLDTASTTAVLTEELRELVPDDNGATTTPTTVVNHLPLEKITARLSAMRAGADLLRTGYSAGDLANGRGSYGPFAFGNNINQNAENGVPGYTALTGGGGLLGDVPIGDMFKLGAAVSYAGTKVKDKGTISPTTTNITSIQGALYGTFDYCLFFMDAIYGIAYNNYKTTRTIQFLGLQAQSKYTGVQNSGRLNAGLTIPIVNMVEVAPMGTIIYNQLTQNRHTETGALGVSLNIPMRRVTSVQAGLGLQVTDVSQAEDFLPELHVLFLNQLKNPNLAITSSFTGGGPSFITQVTAPPKTSINAGISATGVIMPGVLVSLGYDFEGKKNYTSHSASIRVRAIF